MGVTGQPIEVFSAPLLMGRVTPLQIISPQATLMFVMAYEGMTPGVVFRVRCEGYELDCAISDQALILRRNDVLISIQLAPAQQRRDKFIATIVWDPSFLVAGIVDKAGKREIKKSTAPVFPPQSLVDWARREALAPRVEYESPRHVFGEVLMQFHYLAKKIKDTGATNGFWDLTYQGNRIISRTPKRETDIHPQIRLLLWDIEVQKELRVSPEYTVGSGDLDFLVSGRVAGAATTNVCVEFKRAHSPDLVDGMAVQLPEYMERRGTDFAIFGVLDFGPDYPFDAAKVSIPGIDPTVMGLDGVLGLMKSEIGRPFLQPVILDVSDPISPSRMGAAKRGQGRGSGKKRKEKRKRGKR